MCKLMITFVSCFTMGKVQKVGDIPKMNGKSMAKLIGYRFILSLFFGNAPNLRALPYNELTHLA